MDPQGEDAHAAAAAPATRSAPRDPDAAAARYLDAWDLNQAEIARRGPTPVGDVLARAAQDGVSRAGGATPRRGA